MLKSNYRNIMTSHLFYKWDKVKRGYKSTTFIFKLEKKTTNLNPS